MLTSLLFGTLRSGLTRMQSVAGIPIGIVTILQALVIVFVARWAWTWVACAT